MESVSLDIAGRDRFEGLGDAGRSGSPCPSDPCGPWEQLGACEVSLDATAEHRRESETVPVSGPATADTRRRGLKVGASGKGTACR